MNLKSNPYIKTGIFLISFAVILTWALFNISGVLSAVSRIIEILSPFIIGGAIAFVLNTPMKFIEINLFSKKSPLGKISSGLKRVFSYLITLILFLGLIIIIMFIVIPELVNTISDLASQLPEVFEKAELFVVKNLADNPQIVDFVNSIEIDWISIRDSAIDFLRRSGLNWLNSTFSFASSLIGGVVTFTLAFIFSIYVLFQKEKLGLQMKKLILAFLPRERADRIFYIGRLSSNTFSNFLSGQVLESFIIGMMFLIAMSIFKFPYAVMVSIIIGVTAIVPVVGSFIGLIIGVFLILVVDYKMAFWFIIMFLIIQQIEGNVIYPNVVGKAAGLPSIWILVAVTVGGSLMGILGIILFIPIGSILYSLLRETVYIRLKKKGIKNIK